MSGERTYDYIVIGVYFVFMLSLGPIYKGFSKTASDYFRGGGGMLWWVVGSSAFMTTFSAWSFTGGAAKAYETGTFFLVIFACNILSLIFCFFFVVAKYRQMRILSRKSDCFQMSSFKNVSSSPEAGGRLSNSRIKFLSAFKLINVNSESVCLSSFSSNSSSHAPGD